ncbi:MAG TPA: hypothetical protein VEW48_21865 [Thermoanaerobaculia bacterium]|nr:hypothetical protein [Thermoanaerobaculia bacterium]
MPNEATTQHAVVVLFDPATGTIVHGHYCEADAGVELPSREALEKTALEYARRHAKKGVDLSKAKALHVDPKTFQMDRKYRVDPKLKKLVEAV